MHNDISTFYYSSSPKKGSFIFLNLKSKSMNNKVENQLVCFALGKDMTYPWTSNNQVSSITTEMIKLYPTRA